MINMKTNLLFPLFSALIWPETLHNLHSFQAPVSYLLVCVSTGQSTYRDKECVFRLGILATRMERVCTQGIFFLMVVVCFDV